MRDMTVKMALLMATTSAMTSTECSLPNIFTRVKIKVTEASYEIAKFQ